MAVEALDSGRLLVRWNSNIKFTKQLKKVFDRRSGSKKKKFILGPVNIGINPLEDKDLKPSRKLVYSEGQKRRAQQVGKVLYDNIVHLVNSGQVSEELATLSVEIVKVKVVPDFSAVKVYWLSSGTKENDSQVQTLLEKNAGHLRYMLSSLYLLGSIPRLCFVRDDSQAHYLEVEALLRAADFGPDFVPTRLDSSIRTFDPTRSEHSPSFSSSPEDISLQEQFNALNVSAACGELRPAVKGDFPNTQFKERGEQSRTDSGVSDRSESVTTPFSAASEDSEGKDFQQAVSLKIKPPSFTQPSSMDVEELAHHYLPSLQDSAHKAQNPEKAVLADYTAWALNKAFRDDVYKVPHSQLLNKVLLKKQRAGLRLAPEEVSGSRSDAVVTPDSRPTGLKTALLQKKPAKAKGRVKPQSDYYYGGAGFEEVHREDEYVDDNDDLEDYCDEEVEEEDFSATDIPPSRR